MHVQEVIHLILIHLLILVLLHDLEVSVFIVSGPVRALHLVDPLLTARLEFALLNLLLPLFKPIVEVGEEVRLETSVHVLDSVPWNVSTGG